MSYGILPRSVEEEAVGPEVGESDTLQPLLASTLPHLQTGSGSWLLPVLLASVLFAGVVDTAAAFNRPQRGAIYARFSTRFQTSLKDQIRVCTEWAQRNDVVVDENHVYSDEAITGKTQNRAGLQSLLAALERDEIDVVICFATNRLFRKVYRSLQFVEEEIVDARRRCVFVAQNIDTANSSFWRALMQVFSMLDEMQVQMLGGQVRAAHEGLALADRIWGTITFGYTGIEIEGRPTRLGRNPRKWAIDELAADYVRRIYIWYVHDERSRPWIARELNRLGAPLPPKTQVGRWTSGAVKGVLANRRYIGDWSYGRKETRWQNKAGYARQFVLPEPRLALTREHLRIVDDDIFFRAQELSASGKTGGGRPKGKAGESVLRVLSKMLVCPAHRFRILQLIGGNGAMACPECKGSTEPYLYSLVYMHVAERLVLEKIADLIAADKTLPDRAIQACRVHASAMQAPDRKPLALKQRRFDELTAAIQFILKNPGVSETDCRENALQLAAHRAERAEIESQLATWKGEHSGSIKIPTEEEIRSLLTQLRDVLIAGAQSEDREAVLRARHVVEAITGGQIVMSQQGEKKAKRGWLRGTFRVNLLKFVLDGFDVAALESEAVEVSIDFREPTPAEELADAVKELFDQGLLVKVIAKKLSSKLKRIVTRNMVTKALIYWFTSRGLPVPDGRTRRATLKVQHVEPQLYEKNIDRLMELYHANKLLGEIADTLDLDRNTVTAFVERWHREHNLPVPDGRTRRKGLEHKSRRGDDDSAPRPAA